MIEKPKKLPVVDDQYLTNFLVDILNVPSPTGFSHLAVEQTYQALKVFPGLNMHVNHKGALVVEWKGEDDQIPRALTAHLDTLGAMVKEIKSNGRLLLTNVGGLNWNSVEAEGCDVHIQSGKTIRGSLLVDKASAHVYSKESTERVRNAENMEVRIDERTHSQNETRELGIEVGDFVAFDPRVEVRNGFVRSRFLDDKAGVACILAAVQALVKAGLKPRQTTYLHFSNYEEVGHGAAAGIPSEVAELVAVDMAAVGDGQTSDEFHTTICVKDSVSPYHYGLSTQLRRLAEEHGIPHKVDIYPHYGSDGEAFWRAGGDVAVALIGPGVDASHHYERTHLDSLLATTYLIEAYLLS